MKGKSFFARLRHLGFLMHSYSLMKALGLPVSTVLERILTEYQHAISNGLDENGWFCVNFAEIRLHIGLEIEEVQNAVITLIKKKILEWRSNNDLFLIRVNEEELLNFVKVAEKDNDYKMWDYYLLAVQSQILDTEGEESND